VGACQKEISFVLIGDFEADKPKGLNLIQALFLGQRKRACSDYRPFRLDLAIA
jgi:hypothetical protein